jgi:hypothetical protein
MIKSLVFTGTGWVLLLKGLNHAGVVDHLTVRSEKNTFLKQSKNCSENKEKPMRVLVIDDDIETRKDIILPFYQRRGSEDTFWMNRWPTLFLEFMKDNPSFTHISFDHDLGHTDVSVELNRMMFRNPDLFDEVFKDKHIVIHSMNIVGATNILHKLQNHVASIAVIPLHLMKEL